MGHDETREIAALLVAANARMLVHHFGINENLILAVMDGPRHQHAPEPELYSHRLGAATVVTRAALKSFTTGYVGRMSAGVAMDVGLSGFIRAPDTGAARR